jgi:5-oxoprolinase (ATP-hydrolysing)
VKTAKSAGFEAVIGFDMGGTSTDVALYDGAYARVFETEIAGIRLRAPMLAINTVAAGGGSVLGFENGRLRVGPDSAGANPGPACYRKGGPLTVTDANLLLGKIRPAYFPAIFGPHADQALDESVVAAKFADLALKVSRETGRLMTPHALAEGFVRIANANMAQAIRQISVQKGQNPADFTLACFGGAGGQHAAKLADELGMNRVFIHPFAGVLSAFGIGLSDVSVLREQAVEVDFTPASLPGLRVRAEALGAQAAEAVAAQSQGSEVMTSLSLLLRYKGTDTTLSVALGAHGEMVAAFEAAHQRLFGFVTPEKLLVADTLLAEARTAGEALVEPELAVSPLPAPLGASSLFENGAFHEAPIYDRASLGAGTVIKGPAILKEALATTMVDIGWSAEITAKNHCILTRTAPRDGEVVVDATHADPVLLELFANLFMAIAEQAGAVLRNTAQSVNIKERLDFSCAIFDAEGALIANAPHVPVHLGAMGASVRHVIAKRGKSLRPGDAVALNNPYAGGTHLPDITLISPVFLDGRVVFYAANRGHHADVGGLTPGSTPPFSTVLEDEGVVLDDALIRAEGRFLEPEFRAALLGAKYPARNPDQNVADMKAQIAANEAASNALLAMVGRYGVGVVQAYMGHVMDQAEAATRAAILRLKDAAFAYTMDDGATLKLRLTVDHAQGAATIDFTGTGPASAGNFNAPKAVIFAAVLYAFRCLTGSELPLNEGCLRPLTIIIPEGTFLSPPEGAAVVAGNTEVSQAVTSALLGAMGAAAASQSTMNNFLFGNAQYQYYETICGGAGAGPGFQGASAVHTHMTNTRITDPEVMELRYPVRVEEFSVRKNSGGAGIFHGGDGVIRKIRFLEPMTATITASRRTIPPFGLEGGGPGAVGEQFVERLDGRVEALAGTAQAELAAGEAIIIKTPGGGGFGGAL